MADRPINVFFDASCFITVGTPPGNVAFQRIVDLVRHGFITVVTTDLTIAEVVRHHTRETFNELRPLVNPRFRRLAAKHFKVEIPSLDNALTRDQIRQDTTAGVQAMFQSLSAKTLDIDLVTPSVIFADYDQSEGFFYTGNKKDQFPDAFIFECLKTAASADSSLLIVADDTDFDEPVKKEDNIDLVKSVSGLFEKLGLKQNEPGYDLEPILYREVLKNADFLAYVEFRDDDFDGYRVAASCRGLEFDSINAFQQVDENAPLLISVDVTVELDVETEYYDGGSPEIESGHGRVSFYASVVNDENGEPKALSDLRVFRCSLDWGYMSLSYTF